MAFQFFNYNKPGPGVSKDAPPKKRISLYFEIFFRKFFNLIKVNLLFLIPVVLAVALIFGLMFVLEKAGVKSLSWIILLIPLIFVSPFIAGITFVTRNYAREEHAFIFSDFKDAVKGNWKQFLFHGIITYAFISIMSITIPFYLAQVATNKFFYVPLAICMAVSLIFLFMQYYIPVMIITFDLKLKQIYKNAAILAIAGLGRNILLTIVLGAVIVLMDWLLGIVVLTVLIDILLIVCLFFAWVSFTTNFMVYPLIVKLMIKPFYEAKEEEAATVKEKVTEAGAEDASEEETVPQRDEELVQKSEYVYMNGKLVKKSLLDEESLFEDKT